MVNLEQWQQHPSFRKELEEIFNHPTFKIALEIVKEAGNRPILPQAMPPGVTLTEWGSMIGFKRDGYFEALTNLRQLSQTTAAAKAGPRPWENDQPENKAEKAAT
jgi:hypothetical protein